MSKEPVILFEGPCAYAVQRGDSYDLRVHSTNAVTHLSAGTAASLTSAERTCNGLNRHPEQTRRAYGLL